MTETANTFVTLQNCSYTAFYLSIPSITRLVNDVFGKNSNEKVDMEKVTMLIWQYRDDPRVVEFVAQFVAKVRYAGSNRLSKNIFHIQ